MSEENATKTEKRRSEKRQRTGLIQVRVDEAERAVITANADAAGLDLAAFLRKVGGGRPGARTRRRMTGDMAELARLRAELGRVGNNLNQLTKLANIGDLDRPDLLDRTFEELLALLDQVRAAMGGAS